MSKIMNCQCGSPLTLPRAECLVQCSHCANVNLFLCHPIPTATDLLRILCPTCQNKYSLLTCPRCKGTMVIQDYRPGHLYGCPCGFQSHILVCNGCSVVLMLPSKKDYQNTRIQCKKCANTFTYSFCSICGQTNYKGYPGDGSNKCFNPDCPSKKKDEATKSNLYPKMENHSLKTNTLSIPTVLQSNPYDIESNGSPRKNRCKVCLHAEACMIHDQCFHLSICEDCSKALGGKCPICRAEGNYRHVFA